MAERPIKLQELKPGAYVVQPAKKVERTEWTETGITLFYDDGTSFAGAYEDAVMVLRQAKDEPTPAEGA